MGIKKRLVSPQVYTEETDYTIGPSLPKINDKILGSTGISTPLESRHNPTSPAKKITCTARPFSQGYDNLVQYAYNMVVVDGIQQRIAYVECDYFE